MEERRDPIPIVISSAVLAFLSLVASVIALYNFARHKLLKMQPYRIMAYSLLFSGMLALSIMTNAAIILAKFKRT